MRQLKFHCHQHVNDIGYLSLFQAASTPKASPRQMKQVAVVIQEQPPKDFLKIFKAHRQRFPQPSFVSLPLS